MGLSVLIKGGISRDCVGVQFVLRSKPVSDQLNPEAMVFRD